MRRKQSTKSHQSVIPVPFDSSNRLSAESYEQRRDETTKRELDRLVNSKEFCELQETKAELRKWRRQCLLALISLIALAVALCTTAVFIKSRNGDTALLGPRLRTFEEAKAGNVGSYNPVDNDGSLSIDLGDTRSEDKVLEAVQGRTQDPEKAQLENELLILRREQSILKQQLEALLDEHSTKSLDAGEALQDETGQAVNNLTDAHEQPEKYAVLKEFQSMGGDHLALAGAGILGIFGCYLTRVWTRRQDRLQHQESERELRTMLIAQAEAVETQRAQVIAAEAEGERTMAHLRALSDEAKENELQAKSRGANLEAELVEREAEAKRRLAEEEATRKKMKDELLAGQQDTAQQLSQVLGLNKELAQRIQTIQTQADHKVRAVMDLMTTAKFSLSQKLQASKKECERLQALLSAQS